MGAAGALDSRRRKPGGGKPDRDADREDDSSRKSSRPHEIEAAVGGHPVADLEFFCIDPRPQVFEVNFRLPEEVAPGRHLLEVRIGRRKLAVVMLDVVA